MSKGSVRNRLLLIAVIVLVWVSQMSPMKDLNYFDTLKDMSKARIEQFDTEQAKADELAKELEKAKAVVKQAGQKSSSEEDTALRLAQKAFDHSISPKEAADFKKALDLAIKDTDDSEGKKPLLRDGLRVSKSEALIARCEEFDVKLYKFVKGIKGVVTDKIATKKLEAKVQGKLKLGIDLNGGVEFMVAFDLEKALEEELDPGQLRSKLIESLNNRLNATGLSGAEISAFSENTVMVRVPVINEEEVTALRRVIERQGRLEMREFVAPGDESKLTMRVPEKMDEDHAGPPTYVDVVSGKAEIDGSTIVHAKAVRDEMGRYSISKTFNSIGRELFSKMTTRLDKDYQRNSQTGGRMAIILDDVCYSVVSISNGAIHGGSAQITGTFTKEEAEELATVLRAGSLPVDVTIASESRTEASLGEALQASGLKTTIIGVSLVILFIIFYYKSLGVAAAVSLVINMTLLVATMMIYGAAFTLPGIAGVALTLGMAVDANVLIYERIREELMAERVMANATREGFSKAWSAIFDANVTTLMSALILYNVGTGPVQGFAITLAIGIVTTVFTAVFVTRVFVDGFNLKHGDKKQISALKPQKKLNINFWKARPIAFTLSGILLIVSIAAFASKGKQSFSVDFTGGTSISYEVVSGELPDTAAIKEALITAKVAETPRVTYKNDLAQGTTSVEVVIQETTDDKEAEAKQEQKITSVLEAASPGVTFKKTGFAKVGGLVGDQFRDRAIWALVLTLAVIFIYISLRFESTFALGAMLALVHDTMIAVGVFVALGYQISLPVIGAILTVIGYSLNDTIVVFDRIRERSNEKENKDKPLQEVVSGALNETLRRTILTSLTTLFVVIVLCFGGGITEFAVVLTIGILVGTYSSIYVAAQVVCNSKMERQLVRINEERKMRDIERANDQTIVVEGEEGEAV